MKKSISPVVAVIIIIIVLAVIFAVYKLTIGKSAKSGSAKPGDKNAVAPVPEDLGGAPVGMGGDTGGTTESGAPVAPQEGTVTGAMGDQGD
ncbi:MAG: hypothetical protein ACUVX8_08400 [Candidatus Zipacnadales bacterium]